MKIIPESHLDHGLSEAHVDFLLERFGDREAFFIESVELPESLAPLSCGLHGPAMGDEPVTEARMAPRGDREYPSRLVDRAPRPTRTLTVIGGLHEGECVLFTAFGGPSTPREPADPTLPEEQRAEAEAFWADHALSG